MAEFSLESGRDGSLLHLRPVGELDLVAAYELEKASEAIDGRDVTQVVLDLRGLTFIDSTGLHTLVRAASRARRHDCRLVVVRAPVEMDRVFAMTGTYEGMVVVDTPEEALARLQATI